MAQLPPKKGPRMTVASQKMDRTQDFGMDELDAELNSLIFKTQNVIEKAREKMSDSEREEADRAALATLKSANSAADGSQKTA